MVPNAWGELGKSYALWPEATCRVVMNSLARLDQLSYDYKSLINLKKRLKNLHDGKIGILIIIYPKAIKVYLLVHQVFFDELTMVFL